MPTILGVNFGRDLFGGPELKPWSQEFHFLLQDPLGEENSLSFGANSVSSAKKLGEFALSHK